MKHLKFKARRQSEQDQNLMTYYGYDLEVEVDGVSVDNVQSISLDWDVEKDVPSVTLKFIPDLLEVDVEEPPDAPEEPGVSSEWWQALGFDLEFTRHGDELKLLAQRGGKDVTDQIQKLSVSSSQESLSVNVDTGNGGFGDLVVRKP